MAAIKLRIRVPELSNVLLEFDQIKVYRSTTGQAGPYVEITTPVTRINMVAGTDLYEYIDSTGDTSYWYAFSFYNSTTTNEGSRSPGIQGEGISGQYCTLQDIRDEGFTDPPYSDSWITAKIALASKLIEKMTGRWFEPRQLDLTLDGTGSPALRFRDPIITITSVQIDDTDVDTTDDITIYNRHVRQNLTRPDDRDDPRIEIVRDLSIHGYTLGTELAWWWEGRQNIRVVGFFGYTDYDGTTYGKTPDLIKHLCKLVVTRELAQLSDTDGRDDSRGRSRVKSHKTRHQTITWSDGGASGTVLSKMAMGLWTGDPEIDSLISMYRRPGHIRAV